MILVVSLWIYLWLPHAFAATIDLDADAISRDQSGVITASGRVKVEREDETLLADTLQYDVQSHEIKATGHVVISSESATILAPFARLNSETYAGELQDANILLSDHGRFSARTLERLDKNHFTAQNIHFSSCPVEDPAWEVTAKSAALDLDEGMFSASDARFLLYDYPIFYTPMWSYPLRRSSGFLTPEFNAGGSRRGTEILIPYYYAPSDDWDLTLTPRWMSSRGLMPQLEFRHTTAHGREKLEIEAVSDQVSGEKRGRIRADMQWRLPYSTRLSLDVDHVSDADYLADFSTEVNEYTKQHLQSSAQLEWQQQEADWQLLVQHQQRLDQPTNANTLQILPRFQSRVAFPLSGNASIHLEQQTTRFTRQEGVKGIRMDIHPYIEVPWQAHSSGMASTLYIGSHHSRYWLDDSQTSTNSNRTSLELSLENEVNFERISKDKRWRHQISPILRYDLIHVANDQRSLPNFDTVLMPLTLNNLLSGNRFSGLDRIENSHRLSLLVESTLQHKSEASDSAYDLLTFRIGSSVDIRQHTVDSTLKAQPEQGLSNVLGDIKITPLPRLTIKTSGQYNTAHHYWESIQTHLNWHSKNGHSFYTSYLQTDARYTEVESKTLQTNIGYKMNRRWRAFASWHYDLTLKQHQYIIAGIGFRHPCWEFELEGYRNTRLTDASPKPDIGVRFLIDFKGLGSLGES
ncbi:MAG: LPS assembly protein LptD [Mariprofundaceae bacterium]